MKALKYIAIVVLLSAAVSACKSKGSSTTDDSTKDTVAKASKDDSVFKAPLDTIKVDTVERDPKDTAYSRPVH